MILEHGANYGHSYRHSSHANREGRDFEGDHRRAFRDQGGYQQNESYSSGLGTESSDPGHFEKTVPSPEGKDGAGGDARTREGREEAQAESGVEEWRAVGQAGSRDPGAEIPRGSRSGAQSGRRSGRANANGCIPSRWKEPPDKRH